MIERPTPVADGGKGPEILRLTGDLASSPGRMLVTDIKQPYVRDRLPCAMGWHAAAWEQSSTGSPARRRRSQT